MVFRRFLLFSLIMFAGPMVRAQSLGNAGTIEGSVTDQTGASIPDATVTLKNAVSGYSQSTTTTRDGSFRLTNIPPNPYHLEITASGFNPSEQDVTVRNALPVQVKTKLDVAGGVSSVTVEAAGADILETDPSAHVDVERNLILKLPSSDPGGGLSQAITYTTGGVVADANGLFHPLGDHAEARRWARVGAETTEFSGRPGLSLVVYVRAARLLAPLLRRLHP